MATKRKPAATKGVTMYGVILGLVLGLAAAVAVALFVTQVPMPFTDNASRSKPSVLLPDLRDAPDPNLGMYRGSGGTPGTDVTPPAVPSPEAGLPAVPGTAAPGAATPPTPANPDMLGNLIASLGQQAPAVEKQLSTPSPVAKPSPPAPAPKPAASSVQGTYFLQAGAFRGTQDAEAMKARLIMLGMSAQVQTATVNGTTLHRVRVGPFKGLDEMNTVRSRLGGEKIETSVIRQ